jgi:organic hydroperoxide reductase OsmC/OhrA
MNSIRDLYYYEVNLLWNSVASGTLNSPVMPRKIELVTSPGVLAGTKEKWTPEHLLLAAISSCLVSC